MSLYWVTEKQISRKMVGHLYLLGLLLASCCATPVKYPAAPAKGNPMFTRLPAPDGKLHVYALPIGQGDSQVIQCPDGTLSLFDWGSSDDPPTRFWTAPEIKEFLFGSFDLIKNIFLSHQHWDHYKFLPEVFDGTFALNGLENIYISCTPETLASRVNTWVNDNPGYDTLLRTFNNGQACGPNGVDCGTYSLCPGNPLIRAKVLSANVGQHCTSGNKNIDSIVMKLIWGDVSIMLAGDFEDATTSWSENGPQKNMVDYWGDELAVTVYQVSHHGASSLANKPVWRDALLPKAVLASGNPWYGYRHPRCVVLDAFHRYVGTLCKPRAPPGDPFYCGPHVFPSTPDEKLLQTTYTCGGSGSDIDLITTNDWAIYTTTPDANTINLVKFSTDGTNWGLTTDIMSTGAATFDGHIHDETDK